MTARSRPIAAALSSVVALIIATLTFAAPSSAAPYTNAASISLSSQVVCSSETVSGAGFAPGSVALSLQSDPVALGSATADAAGNFSTTVTLPSGLSGAHTIVATQGTVTASASVTIDCPGAGGSTGGGGGLSNTGVAVVGIGALGLALLAGGGAMLLAGKRRKVSA